MQSDFCKNLDLSLLLKPSSQMCTDSNFTPRKHNCRRASFTSVVPEIIAQASWKKSPCAVKSSGTFLFKSHLQGTAPSSLPCSGAKTADSPLPLPLRCKGSSYTLPKASILQGMPCLQPLQLTQACSACILAKDQDASMGLSLQSCFPLEVHL